jgi:hypothetical protein
VTRTFGLRRAGGGGEETLRLEHGDLLVMPPGTQDEWEHHVPAEEAPGERCSIVFRSPYLVTGVPSSHMFPDHTLPVPPCHSSTGP